MRTAVLRIATVAAATMLAFALISTFALSGAVTAHAQSTSVSASGGSCDQYDVWCTYCMNNAVSDLCEQTAPAMQSASSTSGSGSTSPSSSSSSTAASSSSASSTSTSATSASNSGGCDPYDVYCTYCNNNGVSDQCGQSSSTATPMMTLAPQPAAIPGSSWIYCGTSWMPGGMNFSGWPC